jgi:hypothetical protein
MDIINAVVVILGGILAVSGLIIAKKPDAKAMIEKLTPYQALIGVAMVVLGVVNFLRIFSVLTDIMKVNLLWGAAILAMIGVSVVLGLLFGMPQIAKWTGNNANAEHKMAQLAQKVAPYQVMLGLVGIVASLAVVLYHFGVITWHA